MRKHEINKKKKPNKPVELLRNPKLVKNINENPKISRLIESEFSIFTFWVYGTCILE